MGPEIKLSILSVYYGTFLIPRTRKIKYRDKGVKIAPKVTRCFFARDQKADVYGAQIFSNPGHGIFLSCERLPPSIKANKRKGT